MTMVVGAVECRGFRNLSDARTELDAETAVIWGPNGAGKTNLVEAVYFGFTGRSFRAGNDRDMIAFDGQSARVELELDGEGRLLAALDRAGERRHTLGGKPLAGRVSERPLVSVFHPDRLQLVKGAPAHRRAHLDRLCGALWPAPRAAERARRPGQGRPRRRGLAAFLGRAPGERGRAADRGPGRGRVRDCLLVRGARRSPRTSSGGDLISTSSPRRPERARRRAGAPPRRGTRPGLHLLRTAARWGRAADLGKGNAALWFAGTAAPGPPCPAVRRAGRAAGRRTTRPADAAGRRDERARPGASPPPGPTAGRRRADAH